MSTHSKGMQEVGGIYNVVSLSSRRYVGQTVNGVKCEGDESLSKKKKKAKKIYKETESTFCKCGDY